MNLSHVEHHTRLWSFSNDIFKHRFHLPSRKDCEEKHRPSSMVTPSPKIYIKEKLDVCWQGVCYTTARVQDFLQQIADLIPQFRLSRINEISCAVWVTQELLLTPNISVWIYWKYLISMNLHFACYALSIYPLGKWTYCCSNVLWSEGISLLFSSFKNKNTH